jgi:hypothetical protein
LSDKKKRSMTAMLPCRCTAPHRGFAPTRAHQAQYPSFVERTETELEATARAHGAARRPACSALEGGGDGVDGQKHRHWLAVKQALTHALDGHEAEALVEAYGLGLGVGDDSDAADAIALLDGESQHVPKQRLADAETLGPRVDAQTGQTQHGQWIGGQPLA